MKQVLILNITRMGDLVQMGPLLARLQEEWPGVAVDLVVDRRFAPVASMLKGLRNVVSFDFHELIDSSRAAVKDVVSLFEEVSGWARPLAERKYDRLINLTFSRPSAFLAGYIGAPDIRGGRSAWDGGIVIDNAWMAYFTDIHRFRRINRFNLVDVYTLGGSGPGAFAPLQLTLTRDSQEWARRFLASAEETRAQWIAVQAGASDVMKAWRPQSFGFTLARVSERWQGGIVFIGAASERETVAQAIQAYRSAGGRNPFLNATGRTSLEQLAALLAECRLLLTNDTGPMHIAVAVQTPVIDLSVGHVDFQETGPYGSGHWVLQPELDCAPCGFEQVCAHHSCKDRFLPDHVAELILYVLGGGPFPSGVSTYRLYESGVDEDQLGTFRLRAGREPASTAWYAAFWRRYWYESFTGLLSQVPMPDGPAPDAEDAIRRLVAMRPRLDALCQRAEDIVRTACRMPIATGVLASLLQEQVRERESTIRMGLDSLATAPLTTEFMRTLHNDNVQGVDRLALHHANAYRRWRAQLTDIQRRLSRVCDKQRSKQLRMVAGASAVAG
ncbi:MAG: glycosyltransferase family 9 protein [Nitrospira sp.]|nr:glycosyltransferase family 9 protein [Nitrospira sp.]